MISYVARYKKLSSKKSNNYRKMHNEPMMRWVHYIKICDIKAKNADKKRRTL